MKRNTKGRILWFLVALTLGFFISELAMVAREYYQSRKWGFPLEREDLHNYTISIVVGSILHYLLLCLIL